MIFRSIFRKWGFRFSNETGSSTVKHYDYVYGVNPVTIALHNQNRLKAELFLAESKQGNTSPKIVHIISTANSLKIPIKYLPKDKIEKFAKNQIHQGVILKCDPLPYVRISSTQQLRTETKSEGLLWAYFDQITDPQNFGALIRTCFFLVLTIRESISLTSGKQGVDGVLVSEKNRCPLTATVNKVSVGALELMEINCIKEPAMFLRQCSTEGWKVFSTGALEKSFEKKNINYLNLKLTKQDNVIVAFGSEGDGISHDLAKVCDNSLLIEPGIGKAEYVFPKSLVDSLNVSVSAGIILQHLKQRT